MKKCYSGQDKRSLIVGSILLVALILITAALAITGHLQRWSMALIAIFESREHLRIYLEGWGVWAPVVFIFLQALQVVIAPIPGELTGIVGGFMFGTLMSILYSSVGLTVGSLIAFVASRLIGLPFVKLIIGEATFQKFCFLTERRGIIAILILFIIPGFPKDILCYVLGLSPMGSVTFLLVCGLGRIPGTALLSFSGAAIYEEDWRMLVVVVVVTLVCLGVCYLKRDKTAQWLKGDKAVELSLEG
jgi:uncharacterized membrane protein YdjX (TVP38/TMEM64 family)